MSQSAHCSQARAGLKKGLLPLREKFLVVTILLVGCARISPQAVTLSELVSQRVTATQRSHEAFVQGYFGQSRERLEDFLAKRWIPYFLEQYVEDATGNGEDLLTLLEHAKPFDDEQVARLEAAFRERGVAETSAALTAAADALGGGERGRLTLEFAEAAISEIERKRRALLDPIDDLERRTLAELRSSYSQIRQAQSTVTSHLRSLTDVQVQQDHLLARSDVAEQRDRLMQRAIETNERITGVIEAGSDVADTFEKLERSVEEAKKSGNPGTEGDS